MEKDMHLGFNEILESLMVDPGRRMPVILSSLLHLIYFRNSSDWRPLENPGVKRAKAGTKLDRLLQSYPKSCNQRFLICT